MARESIFALAIGALAVACATKVFDRQTLPSGPHKEALPDGGEVAVLTGVVKNAQNRDPVRDTVVVLQCSGFTGERSVITTATGVYRFEDVPTGDCTIHALSGSFAASRNLTVESGFAFRLDIVVDTGASLIRT